MMDADAQRHVIAWLAEDGWTDAAYLGDSIGGDLSFVALPPIGTRERETTDRSGIKHRVPEELVRRALQAPA